MIYSRIARSVLATTLVVTLGSGVFGCASPAQVAQDQLPREEGRVAKPSAEAQSGDSSSAAAAAEERALAVSARAVFENAVAAVLDPAQVEAVEAQAASDRGLTAYVELAAGTEFPADREIFVLVDVALSQSPDSREVYVSFQRPEPDGSIRFRTYEWKAYPGEMTVTGAAAPSADVFELEFIDEEDRVITGLTRKRISEIAAGNEAVPR